MNGYLLRSKLVCLTLSLAALTLGGGAAHASSRVHGITFDEQGDVRAFLSEQGLHVRTNRGFEFACTALLPSGHFLVGTGSERLVISGTSGAWVSSDAGCDWRECTGIAQGLPVVGVFQPVVAGPELWFLVNAPLGPRLLVRSNDGGVMARDAQSLAIVEAEFLDLVGVGTTLIVLGRSDEQRTLLWWSEDEGQNFSERELDLEFPTLSRLAGVHQGQVWAWSGRTLGRFELVTGSWIEEQVFEGEDPELAMDDSGGLWVADELTGLWHSSGQGEWRVVVSGSATTVTTHRGTIVAGWAVDDPGDPWLTRSDDGGVEWVPVASYQQAPQWPTRCAYVAEQRCGTGEAPNDDVEPTIDDSRRGDSEHGTGGCSVGFSNRTRQLGLGLVFIALGLVVFGLRSGRRGIVLP